MLDFVSTREGIDLEARKAAQLVASFIAVRLRDLMRSTSQKERERQANVNYEARLALEYFFAPTSAFEEHMELIGGDAQTFREHLLGKHALPEKGLFTEANRLTVQLRHHWWTHPVYTPKKA